MEDNKSFFFFQSSPLGFDQWSYTRDELYHKQGFFYYFVLMKMHKQNGNQIISEVAS